MTPKPLWSDVARRAASASASKPTKQPDTNSNPFHIGQPQPVSEDTSTKPSNFSPPAAHSEIPQTKAQRLRDIALKQKPTASRAEPAAQPNLGSKNFPDSGFATGSLSKKYVKRVWFDKGKVNFWSGTHNAYIGIQGATTKEVFDELKENLVSSGSIPGTMSSFETYTLKAEYTQQLITQINTQLLLSNSHYKIKVPIHVTMREDPRHGTYMDLTIEFINNNKQSTDGKGTYETQVLNIHFRHDGDELYSNEHPVTPGTMVEELNQKVLNFTQKLHNGTVQASMNSITIGVYNRVPYDISAETHI